MEIDERSVRPVFGQPFCKRGARAATFLCTGVKDNNFLASVEQMAEMMQNPQMRAAMDSVMSNPQMLESMLNMHPQARQMMEANPQMRETLSNPEFLRQMMNPENLRAMAQMQQLFGDAMPGGGLGGGLGGSMFAPPVAPAGPPEEVYASQLSQLNDMGFFSQEENIRALQATGGNVHAAVERVPRRQQWSQTRRDVPAEGEARQMDRSRESKRVLSVAFSDAFPRGSQTQLALVESICHLRNPHQHHQPER